MRRAFFVASLLLLLSACDNATDGGTSQFGTINGFIMPYSDCYELVDKSGFRVELVRAGRSMLTNATGEFFFASVPAFVDDTLIISKEDFWSYKTLVRTEPNQRRDFSWTYLNRVAPYTARITSDWRMDSSVLQLELDTTFTNSFGELVKTKVRRQLKDTVFSVEVEAYRNGLLTPGLDAGVGIFLGSRWQAQPPLGTLAYYPISLQHLRHKGIKSGQQLRLYVRGSSSCPFITGAGNAGPYTDSIDFVVP